VPSVGVSAKFLKHGAKAYKVISVPKSAVPPPLLKVWKVVIIASAPQLNNISIAIEARRWLESTPRLLITRKPYSDYPAGGPGNERNIKVIK